MGTRFTWNVVRLALQVIGFKPTEPFNAHYTGEPESRLRHVMYTSVKQH